MCFFLYYCMNGGCDQATDATNSDSSNIRKHQDFHYKTYFSARCVQLESPTTSSCADVLRLCLSRAPYQLIQNLEHLAIGLHQLLVAVCLRNEACLLTHLAGK